MVKLAERLSLLPVSCVMNSIFNRARGSRLECKIMEILFFASVHVLGTGQRRASSPLRLPLSVVRPRLHEVLCVFSVNTVAEMNKMP